MTATANKLTRLYPAYTLSNTVSNVFDSLFLHYRNQNQWCKSTFHYRACPDNPKVYWQKFDSNYSPILKLVTDELVQTIPDCCDDYFPATNRFLSTYALHGRFIYELHYHAYSGIAVNDPLYKLFEQYRDDVCFEIAEVFANEGFDEFRLVECINRYLSASGAAPLNHEITQHSYLEAEIKCCWLRYRETYETPAFAQRILTEWQQDQNIYSELGTHRPLCQIENISLLPNKFCLAWLPTLDELNDRQLCIDDNSQIYRLMLSRLYHDRYVENNAQYSFRDQFIGYLGAFLNCLIDPKKLQEDCLDQIDDALLQYSLTPSRLTVISVSENK